MLQSITLRRLVIVTLIFNLKIIKLHIHKYINIYVTRSTLIFEYTNIATNIYKW